MGCVHSAIPDAEVFKTNISKLGDISQDSSRTTSLQKRWRSKRKSAMEIILQELTNDDETVTEEVLKARMLSQARSLEHSSFSYLDESIPRFHW